MEVKMYRRCLVILLATVIFFSFTMVSVSEDTLSIAVTEPGWDDIGAILTAMGWSYTQIQDSQLADYDFISQFDVIFINCSWNCYNNAPAAESSLQQFVDQGGTLYASDFAYIYVQTSFPGYIEFPDSPHIGISQTVNATVFDSGLATALGKSEVEIFYDLGSWVPIQSVGTNVKVYLTGDIETD
jgi:hypothetical protein